MLQSLLVVLAAVTFTRGAPPLKDDTVINNAKLQKLGLVGADENVTDSPEVSTPRNVHFPIYAAAARILEKQHRLFHNAANLNSRISQHNPERFHVAHNSISKDTREFIENRKHNTNRFVEEDEIGNVVSGLNLWNFGRKQVHSSNSNKVHETASIKFRQPIQLTWTGGFKEEDSDIARATIQHLAAYDEQVAIHNALHKAAESKLLTNDSAAPANPGYTVDVSKARKEHLAAHAEQVAIHKELQNIAKYNANVVADKHVIDFNVNPDYTPEVARARDEHLAAHKEQVEILGTLQNIVKNNILHVDNNPVVEFIVNPEYTPDVVKAREEHLAAYAEQVSILGGLQKNVLNIKKNSLHEPVVDFKVNPEYTSDVARARKEHLAAYAEQVSILGALQKVDQNNENATITGTIVEFKVNPEYTSDVARARTENLAVYAKQVAIHKPLHAAENVSEVIISEPLVKELLNSELITIPKANDEHFKISKTEQTALNSALHEVTKHNEKVTNVKHESQIESRFSTDSNADEISINNDRIDTVDKLLFALLRNFDYKKGVDEEKNDAKQVAKQANEKIKINHEDNVGKLKVPHVTKSTERCTNPRILNQLTIKSGHPVESKSFKLKRKTPGNLTDTAKNVKLFPKNVDTENVHLQGNHPTKVVEETIKYDYVFDETNADYSKTPPEALSLLNEPGKIEINIVLTDPCSE